MDISAILTLKYPGSTWTLDGDDYAGLIWSCDQPKPTESELMSLWPDVKAEIANSQAEADRLDAYRAEADPLFMKWQAGEGSEAEWLAKRAEIRQRYPYVGE